MNVCCDCVSYWYYDDRSGFDADPRSAERRIERCRKWIRKIHPGTLNHGSLLEGDCRCDVCKEVSSYCSLVEEIEELMPKTKRKPSIERALAKDAMRELCPPGTTVWTVVRHVSRSGMRREISLHIVRDGEILTITGRAAEALGYRTGRHGMIVTGCGMDMSYHTVECLSLCLYGDGSSLQQRAL